MERKYTIVDDLGDRSRTLFVTAPDNPAAIARIGISFPGLTVTPAVEMSREDAERIIAALQTMLSAS